jgi:hypothetical protein
LEVALGEIRRAEIFGTSCTDAFQHLLNVRDLPTLVDNALIYAAEIDGESPPTFGLAD